MRGFYLWAGDRQTTPISPGTLLAHNVTVLPGSYLAREAQGANPGPGIRMALVAETAECLEAAQRIVQFVQSRS